MICRRIVEDLAALNITWDSNLELPTSICQQDVLVHPRSIKALQWLLEPLLHRPLLGCDLPALEQDL